ncbi:MAG: alkaline phosphatase D family protein, partial [Vicinamibacteria bacterium]
AHPSSDRRFRNTPGNFINETPLFEAGLQAFHHFEPIVERFYGATGDLRTQGKRDLYRLRLFGSDAALILLDARSFRDQPLPPAANPLDPESVAAFLEASFDPNRTMLGEAQLDRLKSHLLLVQALGITWKFVLLPEPIQNLGILGASDRFEGYAAERTEILGFIRENQIRNVVFVAADFHGTLVNDLFYQQEVFGEQIPVEAFEIVTGPLAYDPPLGPAIVAAAFSAGLIDQSLLALYLSLPAPLKDLFVRIGFDYQLAIYGYDELGLAGSILDAALVFGSYAASHAFGWTEFEIDAATQLLTVTVYGVDPYNGADIANDPNGVVARTPAVISRFVVAPK